MKHEYDVDGIGKLEVFFEKEDVKQIWFKQLLSHTHNDWMDKYRTLLSN